MRSVSCTCSPQPYREAAIDTANPVEQAAPKRDIPTETFVTEWCLAPPVSKPAERGHGSEEATGQRPPRRR